MITVQLTIPQWLSVAQPTRVKLVKIFSIPRSGTTEVFSDPLGHQRVISDGYTHDDLKLITIEAMQAYMDSQETDFAALFQQVVDKAEEVERQTLEQRADTIKEENLGQWLLILKDIESKARGLNLQDQFTELVKKVFFDEVHKPIQTKNKQAGKGRSKAEKGNR